jgi:hypothetical protein
VRSIDKHVINAFIPVLAEIGATHSNDGNLVFNAM